jgi:prevent-host-death family protein
MSTHSVAQARDQLSDLIDRALGGEDVVITRDGQPVVELKPLGQTPRSPTKASRPITEADLEWLRQHRVGKHIPEEDAATLVRKMRDEGW